MRKPHLANIYLLEKLKSKDEVVEFFKYLNMEVSRSYSDEIVSDVVNISKVQEKILQAQADLNGNVNATLVLEKFAFT